MSEAHHAELLLIINDIKGLLKRIDQDIPLIQLAITASGEKMTTTMTPGISPSRMMQASTLLSFADAQFVVEPSRPIQVGTSFTLSLYMLFLGHSQAGHCPSAQEPSPSTPTSSEDKLLRDVPYGVGEGERKPIWQEVMHKARVRLCRTPVDWIFDPIQGYRPSHPSQSHLNGTVSKRRIVTLPRLLDEYSYHLEIIEDLDDGRVHEGDASKPRRFDDMQMAGIQESIPVHQISKIFYTDTGRILNIGNTDDGDNNPVLLLKRDINAKSPIKMRQEWFEEPGDPDGSQYETADESSDSDSQDGVDRQLWEESEHSSSPPDGQNMPRTTYLPPHLDPEWLALEVYTEDDDDDDTIDNDDDEDNDDPNNHSPQHRPATGAARDRLSVDSKLMAQIRHISLRADNSPSQNQELLTQPPADVQTRAARNKQAESNVARSPFGAITSSLSLLEMLIRLTSLQEFQQTSHLAIPDHILTFFLEETSTTGLQGEAHWRMRSEARRRMGFDPYSDDAPR